MAFAFAPILWGAGIGALSSMAFGKDPIKGAVLGGATGGLLNKIPAGALELNSAQALSTAPTSMGVNLAPVAADAPISYALEPTLLNGVGSSGAGINFGTNLTGSSLPYSGFSDGITGDLGANMAFNPSNSFGMPTMSSAVGKGSIDNLAQYSTGAGTDIIANNPSIFDELKPYLNVRDLTGAAQVASQYQPRPLPTPQGGQVTRGQAPQGTDVMALLQTIRQPERRRITLL